MRIRCIAASGLLAVAIATVPAPRPVAAADLHTFWDDRCAECHGHAGEFARNHFKVQDGRLVGSRAARDVCRFLSGHQGAGGLAQPLCDMLAAQAVTPSLFKERCASCHQTAADLARGSLVLEAGTLKGKVNGRPLAGFLVAHGKVSADEEARLVATLTRVLGEVTTPPGK